MPRRLPLILVSLLICTQAFAWGPLGHSIVGQIAERHLSPQALKQVKELLNNQSLADAANWADQVRNKKEYAYTNTWHWATVPNGQTYESSQKNASGDLIQALLKSERELMVPNNSPQRAVALKFLVHFMADLHQPFHIGREDDRGGNECRVIYMGRETNLHALWDSRMLEQLGKRYFEVAADLDGSRHEAPRIQSEFLVWANESQIMRETSYPNEKNSGFRGYSCNGPAVRLDNKYYAENVANMKKRLVEAGMRLAGILNSILR